LLVCVPNFQADKKISWIERFNEVLSVALKN